MTIKELIESAKLFCEVENKKNHIELIGITDGKAVGARPYTKKILERIDFKKTTNCLSIDELKQTE
ncbi:hypothetical protein D7V86_05485 [bacterium D16-51]|nr:hypothetical protein D7V96_26185 [bacterium D16-59]RKI61515.1 hypothetical protein D7V86_05485 [bacterium D16-51]